MMFIFIVNILEFKKWILQKHKVEVEVHFIYIKLLKLAGFITITYIIIIIDSLIPFN